MEENGLTEIVGAIRSVIYSNEDNGYTVLRLETDSGEDVTLVGCVPYAAPGESVIAHGSWETHAVHGRQFRAEYIQRTLPVSKEAIYEYLAGGTVRGIGPATASMIIDRFGEKSLDVIENHPEELAKLSGISSRKAEDMSKNLRRQAGMRRLMEFICSYGLRPVLAMRLYKYYGDSALELMQSNPYILASDRIGGAFSEADTLALQMGVEGDSPHRVAAAVSFELVHNAGNGHCFIPREKLIAAAAQLIDVDEELAADAVDALAETGEVVRENVAGCDACYLYRLYEAETYTARRLADMALRPMQDAADLDGLIADIEREQGIKYAPLQRKTLELALKSRIVVLTGGPGTGKTTSVRAILAMFDSLGLSTLLAAPTGRAAKRMTELTGRDAATIHRLLGAKMSEDGETTLFTKGEDDPLECGAVILDECSMVDITLMRALLAALPEDCRLILVGDADQLPSVGPGSVFGDIIRSEAVPTVRLSEIFRQGEGSRIVRNAHLINHGEHPNLAENAGDFFRLQRMDAASGADTVVELCAKRLPEKMNIPARDIQVLSPTRKGETGTFNLNRRLQAALNPAREGLAEKAFGDEVFRVGDRVMQIKNNYDIMWKSPDGVFSGTGVYNGDIGVISAIENDAETLTVDYEGHLAKYGFEMLNELEHAWAMTVHKSQGSEYRAVILALNSAAQTLLTRGVLYTAVTRARELLIIVGDDRIAYQMIDNSRQYRRYSGLRVRLRAAVGLE
jgi:exodeoxyribonuclease V alpha subunit